MPMFRRAFPWTNAGTRPLTIRKADEKKQKLAPACDIRQPAVLNARHCTAQIWVALTFEFTVEPLPFDAPLADYAAQADALYAGWRGGDPDAIRIFRSKHPKFLDAKI